MELKPLRLLSRLRISVLECIILKQVHLVENNKALIYDHMQVLYVECIKTRTPCGE